MSGLFFLCYWGWQKRIAIVPFNTRYLRCLWLKLPKKGNPWEFQLKHSRRHSRLYFTDRRSNSPQHATGTSHGPPVCEIAAGGIPWLLSWLLSSYTGCSSHSGRVLEAGKPPCSPHHFKDVGGTSGAAGETGQGRFLAASARLDAELTTNPLFLHHNHALGAL
jgi:hypothetical protein